MNAASAPQRNPPGTPLLRYISTMYTGISATRTRVILLAASLTAFVDGQIARRCNQVSDFGKFLDPLADKLLVIAAMVIFCERCV